MTRREQMIIDDYCEQETSIMAADMARSIHKVARLRKCSAFVYETDCYYILRSFNSYVAFIRKSDGTCFDILRAVYGYTATSAQHIAKFRHDYNATDVQVWREV